jgi:hypothetical protein
MAQLSTPPRNSTPQPNLWPVRAISLLLVVQALGLFGVNAWLLTGVDWEREFAYVFLSLTALDTLSFSTMFTVIAVVALFTAFAFFLRRRSAWLVAMTLQGVILFCCLWIYFLTTSHLRASPVIYLIMLYSILLVLYLNTTDVRQAFAVRQTHDDSWGDPGFGQPDLQTTAAAAQRPEESNDE